MSNNIKFPANNVLGWYDQAEKALADFLSYVPYCDTHEQVWSPKLVTILQETCSQLDSLWRWEAVNIHSKKDVDIRDYFELFGPDIANRWLVFWADEPIKIEPFDEWQKAHNSGKTESSNHPLNWWKEGYQKIKHNRVENRKCATLKRTVESLAGLFLAIIRCEECWGALWERHWLTWDDSTNTPYDPLDCLREDFGRIDDRGKCNVSRMAIESQLFSYGVGLTKGLVKPRREFFSENSHCSNRFKAWYYDSCEVTSE